MCHSEWAENIFAGNCDDDTFEINFDLTLTHALNGGMKKSARENVFCLKMSLSLHKLKNISLKDKFYLPSHLRHRISFFNVCCYLAKITLKD